MVTGVLLLPNGLQEATLLALAQPVDAGCGLREALRDGGKRVQMAHVLGPLIEAPECGEVSVDGGGLFLLLFVGKEFVALQMLL